MNPATKADAERFYRRETPLHGRSNDHRADLASIAKAAKPLAHAEKLVTQRNQEVADTMIETMLREQQGRRKRYIYNQAAVIGIEHLLDHPMDPQTQFPIWRSMLMVTKGTTMPKAEFVKNARAILCQKGVYDHATMAA